MSKMLLVREDSSTAVFLGEAVCTNMYFQGGEALVQEEIRRDGSVEVLGGKYPFDSEKVKILEYEVGK